MTKVKRLATALLACAMMVSVFAMSASAADNSGIEPRTSEDHSFVLPFVFGVGTHQNDTDPDHMAMKEDDSSVYMNCTRFPGSFYVYTNAVVNGVVKDCTQRPALVQGGGEWLIYNQIYETYNRTKACLGGVRAQGGTASGKWSPDYHYYPGDNIPPVNPQS